MSEIKHQWNGTILTVISDSGATSADLKGPKGDTGPRGPQGPGGVIYNADGELVLDLSEYYSKSEVDTLIENVEVDLSGYATHTDVTEAIYNEIENSDDIASKTYVTTEIARAQLEGAGVDTSGFATTEYVEEQTEVDGITIVRNEDGKLAATIGGGVSGDTKDYIFYGKGINLDQTEQGNIGYVPNETLIGYTDYSFKATILNYGTAEGTFRFSGTSTLTAELSIASLNAPGSAISLTYLSTGKLFISFGGDMVLTDFYLWSGVEPVLEYTPIDANFIPVDGVTIIIQNGKLVAVGGGGTSYDSSEEVDY